jgi:hypothetical protein
LGRSNTLRGLKKFGHDLSKKLRPLSVNYSSASSSTPPLPPGENAAGGTRRSSASHV